MLDDFLRRMKPHNLTTRITNDYCAPLRDSMGASREQVKRAMAHRGGSTGSPSLTREQRRGTCTSRPRAFGALDFLPAHPHAIAQRRKIVTS